MPAAITLRVCEEFISAYSLSRMYEKKPRPVQFLTPRNLTVSLRPRNPIIGTVACCARAASGQAAAVPPSSVMNSRRLMSDMGAPPPVLESTAQSAYHTLSLPERGTGRYRPKQPVLRQPRVANVQRGCPRRQSSSLGPRRVVGSWDLGALSVVRGRSSRW